MFITGCLSFSHQASKHANIPGYLSTLSSIFSHNELHNIHLSSSEFPIFILGPPATTLTQYYPSIASLLVSFFSSPLPMSFCSSFLPLLALLLPISFDTTGSLVSIRHVPVSPYFCTEDISVLIELFFFPLILKLLSVRTSFVI